MERHSFSDVHQVPQPAGKTMTESLYRHLTAPREEFTGGHEMTDVTWDGTFNDLSRIHADKHGRLGQDKPQNESVTTKRQKRELQERLEAEYAISMPTWFFDNSFLSDLKAFERTVRAAYLARPSTVLQDGLDTSDQA